jgi:hypothetical protein
LTIFFDAAEAPGVSAASSGEVASRFLKQTLNPAPARAFKRLHCQTVDLLLRAHCDKAAAQRYFEKSIDQNGEPETVTIDKSGAKLAALKALNAERDRTFRCAEFCRAKSSQCT